MDDKTTAAWLRPPVGIFGIGSGIFGAALSASNLVGKLSPGLALALCMIIGVLLGLLAQVALTSLLALAHERLRRRLLPRVAVDVRDGLVVVRIGYSRDHYCEAEMSPDGAMQLARSLVGSALEIDKDSEHRIELQ
jgi:hypothetical protein